VNVVEQMVSVADGVELRTLHYGDRSSGAGAWSGVGPRPGHRTFVLVHGLASNALLWEGVALSLAAKGYSAVSVDLRGHGRSSKPDGPYDLATVADDLSVLFDRLELDRPVVAGQSWGGNVVIELASRYPHLTSGVVPVDGGFINLSSQFNSWEDCEAKLAPPRFAGTARRTFEGWMRSSHPDWPEAGIAGVMGNVEVRADDTIAPWLSFDNHLAVLRGLFDHRPVDRYPSITVPVWWLVAGSGESLDWDNSAASWSGNKRASIDLASSLLSRSRVEWFPDGDHDLHAQYPDRIADLLISAVLEGWFS
jgi:pimeloyl-ACP methyl ester carboxylesterase